MQPDDPDRIAAARDAAQQLGYMLSVDEARNVPAPITHMALAAHHSRTGVAHFLAFSTSTADAAEAGLQVLRDVLEGRREWPE